MPGDGKDEEEGEVGDGFVEDGGSVADADLARLAEGDVDVVVPYGEGGDALERGAGRREELLIDLERVEREGESERDVGEGISDGLFSPLSPSRSVSCPAHLFRHGNGNSSRARGVVQHPFAIRRLLLVRPGDELDLSILFCLC